MRVLNCHSDVIGVWFTHRVKVVRKVGDAAFGDGDVEYGVIIDDDDDVVSAPVVETVLCQIVDKQQTIVAKAGAEVVSVAHVNCHVNTAHVPIGSRVTLHSAYGNRQLTVVATSRHDSGNGLTPAFYTLWLE